MNFDLLILSPFFNSSRKGIIFIMNRYFYLLAVIGIFILTGCENKAAPPVDSDPLKVEKKSDFVYLSTTKRPTELFQYFFDSKNSKQLTYSNGNIIDYSVNRLNGDVLYSAYNAEGGADIWLLPSPFDQAKLIISCSTSTCYSPRFHPNGQILTFQKSTFSYKSDLILKNSEIIFFDLIKNVEIEFLGMAVENGSEPVWSPEGNYLAYYQSDPVGIRIIDVFGNEILFLNGNYHQDFFAWGKDSDHLYFLSTEINNDQSVVSIHEILISKKEFTQFKIALKESELVTGLKFASNQDKVIIGIRYSSFSPAQKMVIYDLLTDEIIMELSDPTISAGNYSWNNSGDLIIYQRFSFDSEIKTPEIAIWDLDKNVSHPLINDAYLPNFLP